MLRDLERELDPARPAAPGPRAPRPASSRRQRRLAAFALVALALLLGSIGFAALRDPSLTGDTAALVKGADAAVHCIARGRLSECDRRADGHMSGPGPTGFVAGRVGQWPLLQYLVAMPMRAAGASADLTLRTLIALNALALVGLACLLWVIGARVAREWGPVLVVCAVTGPVLWYATAAFGEALACFVAAAAVAAVLARRRPWLVAGAVALGGLTKETTPPFLLALCVLCVFAVVPEPARRRSYLVAIVAGTVVSVGLSGLFNVFRFGSFVNSTYMQSTYRVSDTRTMIRYFGALWAAPNGGLLWFWPAAVAVIVFLAFAGLRGRGSVSTSRTARAAGLVVLALLALMLAGLSGWFSPFGWIAWGPRLALPLVPAMVLTAVGASGAPGAAALRRVLRTAWLWVVGAVLAVAALPQVAVVWNAHVMTRFFGPSPGCRDAHVETHRQAYFQCVVRKAWGGPPLLVRTVQTLRSPTGFFVMVLAVVTVMTLLMLARSLASKPRVVEVTVPLRRGRRRRAAPVPEPVLTRAAQPSSS